MFIHCEGTEMVRICKVSYSKTSLFIGYFSFILICYVAGDGGGSPAVAGGIAAAVILPLVVIAVVVFFVIRYNAIQFF